MQDFLLKGIWPLLSTLLGYFGECVHNYHHKADFLLYHISRDGCIWFKFNRCLTALPRAFLNIYLKHFILPLVLFNFSWTYMIHLKLATFKLFMLVHRNHPAGLVSSLPCWKGIIIGVKNWLLLKLCCLISVHNSSMHVSCESNDFNGNVTRLGIDFVAYGWTLIVTSLVMKPFLT